jgi:hydroxymethylglutaryl-CoA reductase
VSHEFTSRIAGFYKNSVRARIESLVRHARLDSVSRAFFERGGGLDVGVADRLSENVIAVHGLPLSVALNFKINGRDYVIPMSTEEPSVVAAASNAARMVRESGGFHGEADPPVMTAQVQFDDVEDPDAASERVMRARDQILAAGDAAIPRMVERGGGCRDLDVRVLDRTCGVLVVHVYIDVGDAMGANLVDSVAEALSPRIHAIVGGAPGLRILSNLPLRRRVRVRCDVSDEAVGGADVAEGIARASRFAELDPYRAVTHNKGLMNGVDAVAVALGQDWRSIEAGVHAWAAVEGRYRPVSVWKRTDKGLAGSVEFPLAIGTVGGITSAHVGVQSALRLLRVETARELAVVMAATGLASNLAALRALASEGIQKGHMRLHHRKCESAHAPHVEPPVNGHGHNGAHVNHHAEVKL